MARWVYAALAAIALTSIPQAMADELVGVWEGNYFCNAPNPVGQLKLEIKSIDGRLVGHEIFSRSPNSGTVVYNVERVSPDIFRLTVDEAQTRDVSFPYHLVYLVRPGRVLMGTYVGHRNCQQTRLVAVASEPKVVSPSPRAAAPKREAATSAGKVESASRPDWQLLDDNEKQAGASCWRIAAQRLRKLRCPSA